MKQFFARTVFCIVMVSFFAACAPATHGKSGYGGKKSLPKQAQEEVVPGKDTAPQK